MYRKRKYIRKPTFSRKYNRKRVLRLKYKKPI